MQRSPVDKPWTRPAAVRRSEAFAAFSPSAAHVQSAGLWIPRMRDRICGCPVPELGTLSSRYSPTRPLVIRADISGEPPSYPGHVADRRSRALSRFGGPLTMLTRSAARGVRFRWSSSHDAHERQHIGERSWPERPCTQRACLPHVRQTQPTPRKRPMRQRAWKFSDTSRQELRHLALDLASGIVRKRAFRPLPPVSANTQRCQIVPIWAPARRSEEPAQ